MPTYEIPSAIVIQKVGEETVILNLDDGQYYGLDEVATRMVELLREHGEPGVVLAALEKEYDASPETLQKDLTELLGRLEAHRLIRRNA